MGQQKNGVSMRQYLIYWILTLACLFAAKNARAEFHEQIAVSTEAISLGNAVTARPPGLMAIHYNPAGLSLLPDEAMVSMGISIPLIDKRSRFKKSDEFKGFFEGAYVEEDIIYGPSSNETEGRSDTGRMYVPLIGKEINFLAAPSLAVSKRKPDSRWTFAIGSYAPYGIGIHHLDHHDDPTRFGGVSPYWQHLIYAAPAVSYRVSDKLAVGMSVGLGHTAKGAHLDIRAPHDLIAMSKILGESTEGLMIPPFTQLYYDAPFFGGGISPYEKLARLELDELTDDFTPSYNLGILYEPFRWLTVGVVYQSSIKNKFSGRYSWEYSENWKNFVDWFGRAPLGTLRLAAILDVPTEAVDRESGRLTHQSELPQRVQVGVKLSPWKKWSFMFDVKWSDWSCQGKEVYKFDQDIQLLRLAKFGGYTGGNRALVLERHWKDTIDWGVGIEYAAADWLDLRLGYEFRKSSIPDDYFDLTEPVPDLNVVGTGAGIHLHNGLTIDIAFAYLFNDSYKIDAGESKIMNSPDFTRIIYNPYVGSDYEQKTYAYMGSFTVTMPFSVMGEILDKIMP